VILKILTWLQMVILSLMAAIGSVYLGALLGGFSELSSLSFPFAYSLAAVLQILFYFFFGYAILLAIYRRLTVPKTPLDPGLGERLGRLAAETQTRMRGKSPVKPLILRKSSNAFNRGKNRIVVGERLVRDMDDQELIGVIGHELAHGMKHHVLIKKAMLPSIVALILAISFLAPSFGRGGVLLWTFAALFSLVQIPVSWRMEYSADAKAAELLGGNTLARALQRLATMNFGGISFTHPPLPSRIRRAEEHALIPFTYTPVAVPTAAPIISSMPVPQGIQPVSPPAPTEGIQKPFATETFPKAGAGEEMVVWKGRPAYHIRYAILALLFFVGIFTIDLGPIGETVGTFSVLLWIVFTIAAIIRFVLDRRTSYYVTNQRVIAGDTTMPSGDLIAVHVEKSFLTRPRGMSKIQFYFKDGRWISFKRVKDAEQVRKGALNLRASLPNAPPSIALICHQCGTRVPIGAVKCPSCNADLGPQPPVSSS